MTIGTGYDAESDLGLSDLAGPGTIADGRIGRRPATGAEYASRPTHNFETRRNVLDASEGANYSGGSSYAPSLPLLPSSVGLAGMEGLGQVRDLYVVDVDAQRLPSQIGTKPWPPRRHDKQDLLHPTVEVREHNAFGAAMPPPGADIIGGRGMEPEKPSIAGLLAVTGGLAALLWWSGR
jgi:hypothetical protein